MNKLNFSFLLMGMTLTSVLFAASSVDRKIDTCNGNITCIAKVLAELIDSKGNSSSIVEFYKDDGHCEFDNLLARMPLGSSTEQCQKKAESVKNRVWGIKIEGVCRDISDMDFVDACVKYATTLQIFPK